MDKLIKKINGTASAQAIQQGLVMAIPLLMIGSFALIFKSLPFTFYQKFIITFANGFFVDFFTFINQVTFGIISLFTVFSVSIRYAQIKSTKLNLLAGALSSALGGYVIFIGLFEDDFSTASFGANGLFTAIFCAVCGSMLFFKILSYERIAVRFYTVGADSNFNRTLSVIIPSAIVLIFAFLINHIISSLFGVAGFEAMFHTTLIAFVNSISNDVVQALLYALLTGLLWFFGIHGANLFNPVLGSALFGDQTGGIINKTFIDVFIFPGGSGATIALLIAVLLSAREKNAVKLAKISIIPAFFNINELMIYGLPILYNPYFLAPFLMVPMVTTIVSYLAVSSGFVPLPINNSVEWVTPILFGGYQATGSVMGSLLQIINIAIGVFIYRWFLRRCETALDENRQYNLNLLIDVVKKSEKTGKSIYLLDQKGIIGVTARVLAEDLRHILLKKDGVDASALQLYYQPQYDNRNKCTGAEALLRWNHPHFHMIYPPLIIMLAREIQLLNELERYIFETACHDIARFKSENISQQRISVNATAVSLQDTDFFAFIKDLISRYPEINGVLEIELTEQMSFILSETVNTQMTAIKEAGIQFAIDDFSMGHTSIKYLQSDLFDLVKLDGSLILDMMENTRSEEIISSIISLSQSIGFRIIAECVETKEQIEKLESLGCFVYQGYYFSPPLPLKEYLQRMKKEQTQAPQLSNR